MHPETVHGVREACRPNPRDPSPPVPSQAADVLVQQQIHAGVDGEVAGQLKLAFARRSVEKEARSWAVPRDAVRRRLFTAGGAIRWRWCTGRATSSSSPGAATGRTPNINHNNLEVTL